MLRHAVQSAVAASATYLLMRWLGLDEAFLAILSAVLIIQPSVGGTMGAAFTRVQATVVGSLISLACLALLPDIWGTTSALALSLLVVGGVAGARPDWSYGAVAAVGIALAPEAAMLETSAERGVAIALGAATGVLAALVIWPDRAEVRFDRHFRRALRATATRLGDALKAAAQEGTGSALHDHVSEYHKAVQQAQEALAVVKMADRAGMNRRLEALRRLYNSVIILERAAEADLMPSATSQELKSRLDRLREEACAALTALAEGDANPVGQTERIDHILAELQISLPHDDADSRRHRNRNALAFGLQEVRRTLAALIDASR